MDFFFRSTNLQTLLQTGIDLDLLKEVTDRDGIKRVIEANPGRDALRVIGPILKPTVKSSTVTTALGTVTVQETAPITDASGNPYQHVNLRVNLPCDIDPITHNPLKGAWLTNLALSKIAEGGPAATRLQAALAELDGMFIIDPDSGEPTDPSNPHEVLL